MICISQKLPLRAVLALSLVSGTAFASGKNRFDEDSGNYYQMAHAGSCQGIPISLDPSLAAHVKNPSFDAAARCDDALSNLRYLCGDFPEKFEVPSKTLHKAMSSIVRDNIKRISCTWTDLKTRQRVGNGTAPVVGARVTPDKTLLLSLNDKETEEDGAINPTAQDDYILDFLTKGDLKTPASDGTLLNYMQFRILVATLNRVDQGPQHGSDDVGAAEIEKRCGFKIPIEVTPRAAMDEFAFYQREETHQNKTANWYPWVQAPGWFCEPIAAVLASECEGPNKPLVQKSFKKVVCDARPGPPAALEHDPNTATLTLYTHVGDADGPPSMDTVMLPYSKLAAGLGFKLNGLVSQSCTPCEKEYAAKPDKPRKRRK